MGGILSTYTKMSRGGFVRGGFCPTLLKICFNFLAFLLQMPLNVEVANELKFLMITLTLNIPMSSSIWVDMIKLGWFSVYIKGSKVRIAKLRYIGLNQQNFSA